MSALDIVYNHRKKQDGNLFSEIICGVIEEK